VNRFRVIMAAENALRVEKKYEKTRKDRLLTKKPFV
jgi:hypothetical protein